MARDLELDLVEVADKANPPVCRIMDYGKYEYQSRQKAKESRRKSSTTSLKEMKYRPKIGQGDFDTKTRKVEGFLAEGHKVKITIMFRGREVHPPELGRRILDRVAEAVEEVGKVEIYPKLDGRNMTMVLAPAKRSKTAERGRSDADGSTSNAPAPSPVTATTASGSAASETGNGSSPTAAEPEAAATPAGGDD